MAVMDDGKVAVSEVKAREKGREEWRAACREREPCFFCMKKPPDGMIAIRGVCLKVPTIF